MAIQNRRGPYANFDKSKLVPGEMAFVTSGDTTTPTGTGAYACFGDGNVQRLVTYEETEEKFDHIDELVNDIDEMLKNTETILISRDDIINLGFGHISSSTGVLEYAPTINNIVHKITKKAGKIYKIVSDSVIIGTSNTFVSVINTQTKVQLNNLDNDKTIKVHTVVSNDSYIYFETGRNATYAVYECSADGVVNAEINDLKSANAEALEQISNQSKEIAELDKRLSESIDEISEVTKNLLNITTLVEGKILNDTGIEINDKTGAYFKQYIPVNEGESYIYSSSTTAGTRRVYWFDANKTLLSRDIISKAPFTVKTGASFMTIQCAISEEKRQLEKGTVSTPYTNHKTAKDDVARKTTEEISDAIRQITSEGRNLFDKSTLVTHKIRNDAGNEVSDGTSSYYTQYVPVEPNEKYSINFGVQRFYIFDNNKTFLRRTTSVTNPIIPYGVFEAPSDCYYIQVQVKDGANNLDIAQIERGTESTGYEEYGAVTAIDSLARGLANSVINKISTDKYSLPSGEADVWEPSDVTDEYKQPASYDDANLNMGVFHFLEENYDKYLNTTYEDYTVTKHTLGQDCSNSYYEMFYYVFSPKNYKKTVLLSSGMNACELSPIFGLSNFINGIMTSNNEDMLALKNTVRFIVLPLMCPYSFEQVPKLYSNKNNVRINKNFNYLKSWDIVKQTGRGTKGEYPDSEIETQNLKKWLSMYSGADLWIDCHSDLEDTSNILFRTILSDNSLWNSIVSRAQAKMKDFYKAKGYFTDITMPSVANGYEKGDYYPKTLYAYNVNRIHSVMIEQYTKTTSYGASGLYQCEANSIKNYATMLSQYCIQFLRKR